MVYDVQWARDKGATDEQIAEYLARTRNFNLQKSLKEGRTRQEIIDELAPQKGIEAEPIAGEVSRETIPEERTTKQISPIWGTGDLSIDIALAPYIGESNILKSLFPKGITRPEVEKPQVKSFYPPGFRPPVAPEMPREIKKPIIPEPVEIGKEVPSKLPEVSLETIPEQIALAEEAKAKAPQISTLKEPKALERPRGWTELGLPEIFGRIGIGRPFGIEPRPKEPLRPEEVRVERARDANIIAMAKSTKLSPSFIEENYDAITKKLGIRTIPTREEFLSSLITVAIGAGLVTAPLPTIMGVLSFMGVKEIESLATQIFKGEKPKILAGRELKEFLGPLEEHDKATVDILEYVLPGLLSGKIMAITKRKMSSELSKKLIHEAWEEALKTEQGKKLLEYKGKYKWEPGAEGAPPEIKIIEPRVSPTEPLRPRPQGLQPEPEVIGSDIPIVTPPIPAKTVAPVTPPGMTTPLVAPSIRPVYREGPTPTVPLSPLPVQVQPPIAEVPTVPEPILSAPPLKFLSGGDAIGREYHGYITAINDKTGEIIGRVDYSYWNGETAVKMIEVDPKYQRQGIATKLLEKLQSESDTPIQIQGDYATEGGVGLWEKFKQQPSKIEPIPQPIPPMMGMGQEILEVPEVPELAPQPMPPGMGIEPEIPVRTQKEIDMDELKLLRKQRSELINQFGRRGEKHPAARMIGGINVASQDLNVIRGRIATLESKYAPEKPKIIPIVGKPTGYGIRYDVTWKQRSGQIGNDNLGKWYVVENGNIVTQDHKSKKDAVKAWIKTTPPQITPEEAKLPLPEPQVAPEEAQVAPIPPTEPLAGEEVSKEAMPVSEGVGKKAVPLPEGWKTEIVPNFRRTSGWQSEVDWKNKRIVFETPEDAKNIDTINHEIAHIRIEDNLGYIENLFDSPFLLLYAKVRKEPKDTHINFIREHLAMDYGEYLTNPEKVSPVLKNLFIKYLPEEGIEKPLTPTIPPSEWKKDPILVADANAVVDRINNEYPDAERLLPEDLEYQAIQKFEDSGMHMWNVNKLGHPKNMSAVYGPIFKLTPEKGEAAPPRVETVETPKPVGGIESVKGGLPEDTIIKVNLHNRNASPGGSAQGYLGRDGRVLVDGNWYKPGDIAYWGMSDYPNKTKLYNHPHEKVLESFRHGEGSPEKLLEVFRATKKVDKSIPYDGTSTNARYRDLPEHLKLQVRNLESEGVISPSYKQIEEYFFNKYLKNYHEFEFGHGGYLHLPTEPRQLSSNERMAIKEWEQAGGGLGRTALVSLERGKETSDWGYESPEGPKKKIKAVSKKEDKSLPNLTTPAGETGVSTEVPAKVSPEIQKAEVKSKTPSESFAELEKQKDEFIKKLQSLPEGTEFTLPKIPGATALKGTWKQTNVGGDLFWKNQETGQFRTSGEFNTFSSWVDDALKAEVVPEPVPVKPKPKRKVKTIEPTLPPGIGITSKERMKEELIDWQEALKKVESEKRKGWSREASLLRRNIAYQKKLLEKEMQEPVKEVVQTTPPGMERGKEPATQFQPPKSPTTQEYLSDKGIDRSVIDKYEKDFKHWVDSIPENEPVVFQTDNVLYMVTRDPEGGWRSTSISRIDKMPMGHERYPTKFEALKEHRFNERIKKIPFEVEPLPPRDEFGNLKTLTANVQPPGMGVTTEEVPTKGKFRQAVEEVAKPEPVEPTIPEGETKPLKWSDLPEEVQKNIPEELTDLRTEPYFGTQIIKGEKPAQYNPNKFITHTFDAKTGKELAEWELGNIRNKVEVEKQYEFRKAEIATMPDIKGKKIEPAKEMTVKTQKDQKKYLIDSIDEAIKEAPDKEVKPVLLDIPREPAGDWRTPSTISKPIMEKTPHVIIEVPRDGTFRVINSKQALKGFKEAAEKRFPATEAAIRPPGMEKIKVPSEKPSGRRISPKENADYEYITEYSPKRVSELDYATEQNGLVGEGWFTNGQYMIKGEPPTGFGKKAVNATMKELTKETIKQVTPSLKGMSPATHVAEFHVMGSHINNGIAISDKGAAYFNSALMDVVRKHLPDAKLYIKDAESPMAFVKDKEVVGILMPMRGDEGTGFVEKYFEDQGIKVPWEKEVPKEEVRGEVTPIVEEPPSQITDQDAMLRMEEQNEKAYMKEAGAIEEEPTEPSPETKNDYDTLFKTFKNQMPNQATDYFKVEGHKVFKVEEVELPKGVKGIGLGSTNDAEGNIYLRKDLSRQGFQRALDHELRHHKEKGFEEMVKMTDMIEPSPETKAGIQKKKEEAEFTRTTPAKGTPERITLDEQAKLADDRTNMAYDLLDKVKKEMRDTSVVSAKHDKLQKRRDKLEAQYEKVEKEGKDIEKQHWTALTEDYAETGDPLQQIIAKHRLKLISNEDFNKQQKILFEDKLKARGIGPDELDEMVRDASYNTSALTYGLDRMVDTAIASVRAPALRDATIEKIKVLDLPQRSMDRYIGNVQKSSIWPDDIERYLKDAQKEAEETGPQVREQRKKDEEARIQTEKEKAERQIKPEGYAIRTPEGEWQKVEGSPVKASELPEYEFFVYKSEGRGWVVIENSTGHALTRPWARKTGAIDDFRATLQRIGADKVRSAIEKAKREGVNYKPEPIKQTPEVPIEEVAPQKTEGKEPWGMTKEEYIKSIPMSEYVKDMEPAIKLQELKEPTKENILSREHKRDVRQALTSGDLTPAEYARLHEKDYGKIEEFVPEVGKKGGDTDRLRRIAEASQEAILPIAPVYRLMGTDGKWHSPTGFPTGVSSTGEKRLEGYAFRSREGSLIGKIEETEDALRERWQKQQDKKVDDFYNELLTMPEERIKSQEEYWLKKVEPQKTEAKSQSPQKALGTGSAETDKRLARLREMKQKRHPMTAMQEKALALYEAQVQADPSKWNVGDGVGWRVDRQINRGFRVEKIDPEQKLALVIPVADTGLTVTGGGMEGVGKEWVHIADLVRDKKYDMPADLQSIAKGKEGVATVSTQETKVDAVLAKILGQEPTKTGEKVSTPIARPDIATKLRQSAESLTKQINEKRSPAVAQQNVTARRARQVDSAYTEADHLENLQNKLNALADAHETGTLPESLQGITSKTQVESILRHSKFPTAYLHNEWIKDILKATEHLPNTKEDRQILSRGMSRKDYGGNLHGDKEIQVADHLIKLAGERGESNAKWAKDSLAEYKRFVNAGIDTEEKFIQAKNDLKELGKKPIDRSKEQKIRIAEQNLLGRKIPGYWPTPKATAERLIEEADIQPGMTVLEPSAGKGNIADVIRETAPDADLKTIEWQGELADILRLKGHEVIGSDFLEHQGNYDRIVMDPPFEKFQDIDHVRHAYDHLNPSGRLVSIMSESPFFRSDKKAVEFREWLDSVGGTSEKLPEKSFAEKSERATGVSGRIVVIDKPSEKKAKGVNSLYGAIPLALPFLMGKGEEEKKRNYPLRTETPSYLPPGMGR